MIFSSVRVQGFRSIEDSGKLPLGPVTLVIGRNNTGKSSLLRSIYAIQGAAPITDSDIRIHHEAPMIVELGYRRIPPNVTLDPASVQKYSSGRLRYSRGEAGGESLALVASDDARQPIHFWQPQEPENLIFPVLSRRHQPNYDGRVDRQSALGVYPNDGNLVAKLSPLLASNIEEAVKFRALCTQVLNVELGILAGDIGQKIGTPVDRYKGIPIEAMGSGVSTILGFLAALSTAKQKLFIVEEPENDLHPQALKALLAAIVDASRENQFIISTHNSVVLAKLGALPDSVVLHTATEAGSRPPKTIFSLKETTEERLHVLQDLGYELADLGLGDGWLIFEESSAERIVRQWLIPWFAPELVRLRTIGASGTSRLGPLMQDFHEMFLFAHLEQVYRNRAWVVADGDKSGIQAIEDLRRRFRDWNPDNFRYLRLDCLERYYPHQFSEKVDTVLAINDKHARRKAKQELLHEVLAWIETDRDAAREGFQESAAELIDILQEIQHKAATLQMIPTTP